MTVLQNVMEGPVHVLKRPKNEAHDEAMALLRKVGIAEKHASYPSELSGGQQQRVAIARAMANDPGLILADEPTGNLDEETGNEILDVLSQLHQDGLSIVMVTHNTEIARRGDLIVHLRHGQIESPATMA